MISFAHVRAKRLTGIARRAGVLMVALAVSAGIGALAQNSSLAEPSLDVVMYLAEDSTAEFFYSDEFGNFSAENSVRLPVLQGVNNLSIPLRGKETSESFSQRLDPCECNSPVAISRLNLSTPLLRNSVSATSWVLGPDIASISTEGSVVTLRSIGGGIDPYVVLFMDVDDFSARGELRAFIAGFVVSLVLSGALFLASRTMVQRRKYLATRLTDAPRRFARVSRAPGWLVAVSATLISLAAVQQVWGAWTTGATIDEPLHVGHLTNYFASGNYSSSAYGPATSLLGHSLNVVLGFEQWGQVSSTAEAYAGRHLAIALLGITGLVSVGLVGRVLFDSWRWGVVTASLLAAIPLWVGHSMFNIKDVPLATGFTMVTAGLALLLSHLGSTVVRILLGLGFLGGGAFLAVGTRPGSVAIIAVSIAVALALWLLVSSRRWPSRTRLLGYIGAGVLGSFVVGILVLVSGPAVWSSLARSVDFPWDGWNLYGGERVESNPGLVTLVGVFASYLPLVILVLVVMGVAGGIVSVTRLLVVRRSWHNQDTVVALVFIQGLGAFAAVAVLDPVIYDGGRQILFVVPALAVIATLGFHGILTWVRRNFPSPFLETNLLAAVVAVGLVVPAIDQIRLFPYNYSYYNVVAQGAGVNGSWETDYWGSSIREAAEAIAPGDPVTCRSVGDLNLSIGSLEPCPILAPYVRDSAVAKDSRLEENHFWVIRSERTLSWFGPISSDNCEFHSQVTRPLRGEDVSMAWVYQCEDR